MVELLKNKDKEKNPESIQREMGLVRMLQCTVDFSLEIMEDKEVNDTFKVLKEKNCHLRILCPVKTSFRS